MPALPFISSVTLRKSLNLSNSQFAHLLSEDKNSSFLKGDNQDSNEKKTQCLQHAECLLRYVFILFLFCVAAYKNQASDANPSSSLMRLEEIALNT